MEDVVKFAFRIIVDIIVHLIFSPVECYEILKDEESSPGTRIIAGLALVFFLVFWLAIIGLIIWLAFFRAQ
tara:strand:+ start:42 stop:254 length:213 start_codon:yes stop_codon:yes gene_type:complete